MPLLPIEPLLPDIRAALESAPNLRLFQQEVADLLIVGDRVQGCVTQAGIEFRARAVVLTVGTFLAGKIHVGLENYAGGRAGDPPSNRLAARLRELNLRVGRLKTGTPPRIDGRSIDRSVMQEQPGDAPAPVFSYLGDRAQHPRGVSCFITATNPRAHELIRAATDRSPLFTGIIEGVGPRYCPSIEDKIVRFADIERFHKEAPAAAHEHVDAADSRRWQTFCCQHATETIAAPAFTAPRMRTEEKHGLAPSVPEGADAPPRIVNAPLRHCVSARACRRRWA